MSLIRKIKISKLTNIPLEGRDKDIVDYIKLKLSDLSIVEYQEYMFSYVNSSKKIIILEYNYLEKVAWVYRHDLWRDLEYDYKLNRTDIVSILKYLIQINLKIEVKEVRVLNTDKII